MSCLVEKIKEKLKLIFFLESISNKYNNEI